MKLIKFFGLVLLTVILAAGCASIKPAGDEDILEIIGLINSGNHAELTELSSDSFLLDAEIMHSPAIIDSLWLGLSDSGFKMDNPVILESRPPQGSDKALFGSSPETEAFFSRYIPAQSMFFRIGTDSADYAIILGPVGNGTGRIIAFGGPF